MISQMLAQDRLDDAKRVYQAESRWFFTLGLPVLLLLLILPSSILASPFGSGFGGGVS